MHPTIPLTVGVLAVALFLLSYQQKKRRNIILLKTVSRGLYILQYFLLGKYEGAALDILGAISSVIAGKKHTRFLKKYAAVVLLFMDAVIIAVGLILYENIFSLFPIIGVLLHTSAFWLNDETVIRRVSLAGSPFWFVYNVSAGAYGSAVGDILTVISILVAMFRHRKSKAAVGVAPNQQEKAGDA